MRILARAAFVALLISPPAAGLAVGCGGGSDTGSSGPTASTGSTSGTASGGNGGAGGNGGGSTSTYTTTGSGNPPTDIAECQGHIYECGDLVDNDNDGLMDSQDPDCLGPCDNTENSYYGGIPGSDGQACVIDCYFDQDSGAGNDGCYWNHKCDEHEAAPGYYPESVNGAACAYDPNANTPGTSASCDEMYNTQADVCMNYCGPLTPNGCDCFGCCELPAGGGNFVFLGSIDADGNGKCTMADVADPDKCEPCKPVAACLNGCGPCELCIGKTELPPECFPDGGGTGGAGGGGAQQCSDGVQPCGLVGQDPCPLNYYCITGCCIKSPN